RSRRRGDGDQRRRRTAPGTREVPARDDPLHERDHLDPAGLAPEADAVGHLERAERREPALPAREPAGDEGHRREGEGRRLAAREAGLPMKLLALVAAALALGAAPASDPGVTSSKV